VLEKDKRQLRQQVNGWTHSSTFFKSVRVCAAEIVIMYQVEREGHERDKKTRLSIRQLLYIELSDCDGSDNDAIIKSGWGHCNSSICFLFDRGN
jgi:hypothetical protein